MMMGEAARRAGAWTAGIVGLLVVTGILVYGTWWVVAGMFREPPPPAAPAHVIVGLDLSQGNPLVLSDVFSSKAARRVASMMDALPMRSRVTLRTFGSYTVNANPLQFDRVISRRHPPDQVKGVVQGIVAGVPKLIAEGRLQAQQHSNIVPFLQNMAEVIDCTAADTFVVLVTDGLEESELAVLTGIEGELPAPAPMFDGCQRLEILGIGQGLASVSETQRLRRIWQGWAERAGFKEFRGLNDW